MRSSRWHFRERLFAAMLAVALAPLLTFTALVVFDLGSVSRTTVDETHRTILEGQQQRQLGQVSDRAKLVDLRLSTLASEVRQLHDALAPKLRAAGPLGQVSLDYVQGVGFRTARDSSFTLVAGHSSSSQPPAVRAARLAGVEAQAIPLIEGVLRSYPEVEAMWVVDNANYSAITVPGFDVAAAVSSQNVSPNSPVAASSDSIFSAVAPHFAVAVTPPDVRPSQNTTSAPMWSGPYRTTSGDEAVTVWLPVGDGQTVVGADISIGPIADTVLNSKISGDPNAYPILLSETNKVLAAGGAVTHDFGATAATLGSTLKASSSVAQALMNVGQSGDASTITARLAGVDKQLFAAPIATTHWVLTTVLPQSDLEPDVTSLQRGINSGISRVVIVAVPLVVLLLLMAMVMARFLARRLVEPVNELRNAAERLADGHTDEAVPPQGTDEVGVLAASLERMRREINNSRDTILAASRELEHRVDQRTSELRVRNDELIALNELAGSLTRSLDPDVILEQGLAAVRAILPISQGCGYILNEEALERRCSHVDASRGRAAEPSRDSLATLNTIAAAAVDEAVVVVRRHRGKTVAGIPLGTRDGILGALGIVAKPGVDVERSQRLLRAIADQVGLALRTSRLSSEGRDTAVLEERTRLAREIHDTLAQQLTAIVLQLETADALYPAPEAETAGHHAVVTARDLARAALREARRSVWDLRPQPLATTGLAAAIETEVEQWAARNDVSATFAATAMPRTLNLKPHTEVALLRIAQEALSNIAKHSGATTVTVELGIDGDALAMTVSDNGHGFDISAQQTRQDAFGLVGMRERALLAGGRLEIESGASGTAIKVTVPLAAGSTPGGAEVAWLGTP